MKFKIQATVKEEDTGRGLSRIRVKAYDKDLIYDDLLGEAITDKDGFFEMNFLLKDFRELFERRPDLYFTLETMNGKSIYSTISNPISNAAEELSFDIIVPSENLANEPIVVKDKPEGIYFNGGLTINHTLNFNEQDFTFGKNEYYDTVQLKEASSSLSYELGVPSVPYQVLHFALPSNAKKIKPKLKNPKWEKLGMALNLGPAQHPRPALPNDNLNRPNSKLPLPPIPDYFQSVYTFTEQEVPINEEALERDSVVLNEVELGNTYYRSSVQIITVKVYPMKYNVRLKEVTILKGAELEITYDLEKQTIASEGGQICYRDVIEIFSLVENYKDIEISLPSSENINYDPKDIKLSNLREWEIRPDLLDRYEKLPPVWLFPLFENWPYIIITDNNKWDEQNNKGDSVGNFTRIFEELARWKTRKGTRGRVVTVSDIMSNRFGSHYIAGTTRDVPEAIRNFLKYAYQFWNTRYCLMGGDIDIVPIRYVHSQQDHWGYIERKSDELPSIEKLYQNPEKTFLRYHSRFILTNEDVFFAANGADVVRYNPGASATDPGWYYTNETYTTASETPTKYILIKGPGALIERIDRLPAYDTMQPTDLYYASLFNPLYNQPGKHDWDNDDNGIYGWSTWGNPDGVAFNCDICIGRAPVENETQVQTFVDKVISYESLINKRTGERIDGNYLKKVLANAASWGSGWLDGPFNKVRWAWLDGACQDKEDVIDLLRSNNVNIETIRRFYEDLFFVNKTESNLAILDGDSAHISVMRDYVNTGVHFVTSSGHGWWGGAGGFASNDPYWVSANHLNNFPMCFVMFMDSCLTSQIDADKAPRFHRIGGFQSDPNAVCLAKNILRSPNGGGIAYVGYTRLGAVGATQEKLFWKALSLPGMNDLGNMMAYAQTKGIENTWPWQIMGMILLGDPETMVYKSQMREISCSHTAFIYGEDKFTIGVFHRQQPVYNARVCISQLSDVNPMDKNIFELVSCENGYYTFDTRKAKNGRVDVVVSGPNIIPYIISVQKVENPISPWKQRTKNVVHDLAKRTNSTFYAGSKDKILYALSAASSNPIWSRNLNAEIRSIDSRSDGNVLACTTNRTGNNLFYFDLNGTQLLAWNTGQDHVECKLMPSANLALSGGFSNGLMAYRTTDGASVWHRNDLETIFNILIGSDNRIYVAYMAAGKHNIACLSPSDGITIYNVEIEGEAQSFSIDVTNKIYAGTRTSKVYAINTLGINIWEEPFNAGMSVVSIASRGNDIYAGTGDGHIIKLGPDKSVLWNVDLGDRIEYILPRNNSIIVGCWHGVFIINQNGEVRAFRETTGAVVKLLLLGNDLYAGCRDGFVYKIEVGSEDLILPKYQDFIRIDQRIIIDGVDIALGNQAFNSVLPKREEMKEEVLNDER